MFIFCQKPRALRGAKIAAAALLLALLLFYVLPKLLLELWFLAPEEEKIYDHNQYPAPMRVEDQRTEQRFAFFVGRQGNVAAMWK